MSKEIAIRIHSFMGLLLTAVSLFLSVSALVKDTWITGGFYKQVNWQNNYCVVRLGFFSACNSCTGCGGTFSWVPGAIDSELYTQWTTLQAFFIMHLFFATSSFVLMQSTVVKPCLVSLLKYGAPTVYILNFLTGMIALTLSTTQPKRLSNYGYWNSDISITLQIASFTIASAGLIYHGIAQCLKARQAKAAATAINAPLLGDGMVLHNVQPQQIAVVVNGQTVMATLNPSQMIASTPSVAATPATPAYAPVFSHPQPLMTSWGQSQVNSPSVFYQALGQQYSEPLHQPERL